MLCASMPPAWLMAGVTFLLLSGVAAARDLHPAGRWLAWFCCQRMKSVERKRELRSVRMDLMSRRLSSVPLAATSVRIVKTLRASETDSVPSAESFLPVKGKASGPRWH